MARSGRVTAGAATRPSKTAPGTPGFASKMPSRGPSPAKAALVPLLGFPSGNGLHALLPGWQLRQLGDRQSQFHQPFNSGNVMTFIGTSKGDGVAARAGAGSTPDAVDVVLSCIRQIVVYYQLNVCDVDASGGDIGRDKHAVQAALESSQSLAALRQGAVGVDLGSGMAQGAHAHGDLLGAELGAGEDQDGAAIVLEDLLEETGLVFLLHEEELLGDLLGGLPRVRYLHPGRHLEESIRHLDDGLRHGGGEKQGLSACRQLGEDLFQLRSEAHVQHAVGLVQDDYVGLGDIQTAALQVVDEAAGGADHDLRLAGEVAELLGHGLPSYEGRGLEAEGRANLAEGFKYLGSQFPGRDDYESEALLLEDPLDQRNAESQGLAGACLSYTDQILALQGYRDGLGLNGGRDLEAGFLEDLEYAWGDAQAVKCVLRIHGKWTISRKAGNSH